MNASTNTARRGHVAAPRRSRAIAPAIPRRVSGPIARPATAGAAALPARGLPARRQSTGAFERLASLPDHRLIDRLLRGRLWIWLIGLSLGGIVAMQVSLLKLNTGISRAVQSSATLEHQNATLEAGIARLSSRERLSRVADTLAMHSPQAGDVTYLRVRPSIDGRRAAGRMSAPSEQARAMLTAAATGVAGEPLGAASAQAPSTAAAEGVVAPAGTQPTAPTAPVATAPVAATAPVVAPTAPVAAPPEPVAAPAPVAAAGTTAVPQG